MKRILENVEIMRKNKQYAVTNGIFLKGVFPRNYNNQIQIYLGHHSHNMDIVGCQILLILMVIILLIMFFVDTFKEQPMSVTCLNCDNYVPQ